MSAGSAPTASQDRPPYVSYELRSVEDRSTSTETTKAYKDVAFALITPMGSKDRIERVASEWFVQLRRQTEEGRFKHEWLYGLEKQYEAWKNDQEAPVDGTPLKAWPMVTPAQYKTLTDLRLRSVEDLACANEEVISRIGMGGRTLSQKAKEWLESSKASAPLEELSRLKVENSELRAQVGQMSADLKELMGLVRQTRPDLVKQAETPAEAPSGIEADLGMKL